MNRNYLTIFATLLLLNSSASLAVPITSFNDPSLTGAKTIDFDNYTTNAYLNDFSVDVVSFHNEIQYGSNYFVSNAFLPGHSGNHIGLYGGGYVTFDGGVNAVAFSLGAINNNWSIEAFSQTGDSIEKLDIINPTCCSPKVYGFAANDIWGLRFTSVGTTLDVTVMDNFKYVVSVPEPFTSLLFAVGLVGISLTSRRQLANKSYLSSSR
ncbi:MAG: hypothetical protein AMJ53_14480 [Gammaproteobacteria bacterium SG8_11]|nr:MAG: hypothetical protein AMJ53_14480 [Gammaproteobacteria bacterium SG8_11]